jgi:eukaryotic-like serine/threonine-protein kinase
MSNIGKYAVIRELGAGATSKVVLALDTSNGQNVAIKLIDLNSIRDMASAKALKKLLQVEVSLVGKLKQPNIVQMLDAEITDDISYIVMEYVDGGTLEQFTEPGHLLPFRKVAELMYQCCKALEFAQAQGVIHRDIKPANILLQGDGDAKITDFGAAVVENVDSTMILGVGSLAYMSPEQVTGGTMTHQTDIYSLGMTMWKLLTGKLPFTATSRHGLMLQIESGELPAPRTQRPETPDELEVIVRRATRRDLSQRYQTWGEFGRDLAAYLFPAGRSMGDTEKVGALRRLPFFEKFSDAELREALQFCKWHRISNGNAILNEGDMDNSFFIVVDGTARATKGGKLVATLQKGDCFGEVRRLPDSAYRRSTGIEAGSNCTLFEVDLDVLTQASLECRFQFDEAFLYILLRRLEGANTRISKLLAAQQGAVKS